MIANYTDNKLNFNRFNKQLVEYTVSKENK